MGVLLLALKIRFTVVKLDLLTSLAIQLPIKKFPLLHRDHQHELDQLDSLQHTSALSNPLSLHRMCNSPHLYIKTLRFLRMVIQIQFRDLSKTKLI
jgi:hypothetical protein